MGTYSAGFQLGCDALGARHALHPGARLDFRRV
jgi:hypothetical protein